ncbi:MAG: beta-ketoacyl-ACP synthase III [Bacillota bacterium]|nr:beta-ketoacyl-ACP synthase III [Bacillota bacterium]
MCHSILGTGMYVPETIISNDALAAMCGSSDQWIRQRVGVKQRHVCTEETAADLAVQASVRALENAGCKPEELDLILAATVSGELISPSVSCMVQRRLGVNCLAMDINAACSSFIFLLETAAGFFARKKLRRALVIGAERMSRIVDWEDRSTCVIFGDGAGAVVLGPGNGYMDANLTVAGGDEVICIPHFTGKSPFFTPTPSHPYIHMEGQETFKFAVNALCRDVRKLLADNGLAPEDVAYIVPHQANLRIIELAAARLGFPLEKFYVNIQNYGNTSSASIPIALDEMNRGGMLKRGDLLIFAAFGGGLSNAACLVKW